MRVNVKPFTHHGMDHCVPKMFLPMWRKAFCRRGWHCFKEIGDEKGHHFLCEACGVMVNLGRVSFKLVLK
jgi:hypothetical protein